MLLPSVLPFCRPPNSYCSCQFCCWPLLLCVWLLLLLCWLPVQLEARFCYSCSGQCMAGAPCNCQTGVCEADYCFAEKKPSEVAGVFRLSKGCVKRPSRTTAGCDFEHFADHLLCVCAGPGDFCNDHILIRVNTAAWRNVTCRNCPDGRPDCGQTCQGQWCHQKTSTGASGCGFGPPSLPYLYQTPDLLRQQPKVCLSLSRGSNGSPHQFCVCVGNLCNEPEQQPGMEGGRVQGPGLFTSILRSIGGAADQPQQQQRSIGRQWEMAALTKQRHQQFQQQQNQQQPPLHECVSCDLSSEDTALTSNCRQNRCHGQFCVYAAQRVFNNGGVHGFNGGGVQSTSGAGGGGSAIMHEKRGCMNVSEPSFVQLGCAHKWVQNELEEIYCACRGPLCNVDLSTASASSAPAAPSWRHRTTLIFFVHLLLPVLLQLCAYTIFTRNRLLQIGRAHV